ncbi:MAG: carboxypeptidase regulatory-like domain-containing protein, partial [Desulfobacteraceae bacterium]
MRFQRPIVLIGLCLGLFAFMAQAVTYEYDDFNRIKKAVYSDNSAIEYTYDNAGNRLAQQITPGQPAQLEIEVAGSHGRPLQNVRVYAFSAAGHYTSLNTVTDSEGRAFFDPAQLSNGQYKFRVDYLGGRF